MEKYGLEGLQIIRATDKFTIDNYSFYVPAIVGCIFAGIFLLLAFITIRKGLLNLLFVSLTIASIVIGVKVSINMSKQNITVNYTDVVVKLKSITEEELRLDYKVISKNTDGTYTIRLYW